MSSVIKAMPVVFSGPSGVGKSTLLKRLFKEFPDAFGFSVSHTTRPPRPGEINGQDYHFVTRDDMLKEIKANNFIEHAEFANKMYGTSKKSIQDVIATNKICILDVDEQGVKNIKGTDMTAKYIFIQPPSIEELENRLKNRGTETDETIKHRMDTAKSAMEYAKQKDSYDICIVNDDLETAYNVLRSFMNNTFPDLIKIDCSVGPAGDGNVVNTTVLNIEKNQKNNEGQVVAYKPWSLWSCSIL